MAALEAAMSKTRINPLEEEITAVTITEFKARAREVIDSVSGHKAVAILRHNEPDAVLISAAEYAEFVNLRRERLNFLSRRYDDMVAGMQTAESAAGVDALFSATEEELGRAALAADRRG
jgi:prevent-host-death family protein